MSPGTKASTTMIIGLANVYLFIRMTTHPQPNVTGSRILDAFLFIGALNLLVAMLVGAWKGLRWWFLRRAITQAARDMVTKKRALSKFMKREIKP